MIQQTNKYALCKFSKTVSTTATCKGTSYRTILIEQIEVKVKITLQIVGESKETNKLIDSGGREAMVKIARESKGNDHRRELGYRRRTELGSTQEKRNENIANSLDLRNENYRTKEMQFLLIIIIIK
jgi:hypothetical protein